MQPDLRVLNPAIREGNRLARGPRRREAQAVMIAALSERYVRRAPPATFRLIVNPMVTWIWIGGLIVLAGALIALWPSPLERPPAGVEPLRGAPRPRAVPSLSWTRSSSCCWS